MQSFLPSIIILGTVALVAAYFSLSRVSTPEKKPARLIATRVYVIAILVQCVHFAEEATTGLNEKFPELFGLPPVSLSSFEFINLTAIVVWLVSVPGVRTGWTGAYFFAWFLALAGIFNLVGHPAFAIYVGGYFPGLYSSPFISIACIWLFRKLYLSTQFRGEVGKLVRYK